MEILNQNKSFNGTQYICQHQSTQTATPMRFAVYVPQMEGPEVKDTCPVLWYLSGLTCTEENFTVKSGVQRLAAKYGLMVVAPDTSPRGAGIEGEDDAYDFGTGAGFYLDASVEPWSKNYRMYSYIVDELPNTVFDRFPGQRHAQGIFGHSMGGHGALTIALKHPDTYRSVSAFAPICAPSSCDWGRKALTGYLGDDHSAWSAYDATELVRSGNRCADILIDQGASDEFLENELQPQLFEQTCKDAGQAVQVRYQEGYDHSYYFIASFMEDHMAHHAQALKA